MSEIKNNKKLNGIVEEISSLSLGEISELVDTIKEKLNIQETAMVQPVAAAQASEKVEEKGGNVALHVLEIGAQAIKVYGEVKDIVNETGGNINIVNAKKMIEEKKPILENITKTEADKYKKRLEEKGAKVEIK